MSTHLIAIFVLLVLSAMFSATETAFTSLSLIQHRTLQNKRSRSARMAYALSQQHDVLITTVLVGNNVVNISVSALVTTYAIRLFSNSAVGYATGILTIVILIFGEITPKQIAMSHNMKIASFMAYPIKVLTVILYPVIWLLIRLSHLITRIFAKNIDPAITTEGVRHMVGAAEDYGLVDQYESDLMHRAIQFSDTQVKTIMSHRTSVFCISDELSIGEAFPSIVRSGFSRVPVYHQTSEDIIGIVLVRDILRAQLAKKQDKNITTIMLKPLFVPEQMHLDNVFYLFKKDRLQLAIVLDEYGGFSGVVTMEDVAEQLFGELYDEHERRYPDRIVEQELRPGTYLVMADTPFLQLVDELSLHYESEGSKTSTVAAYLMSLTGDIPEAADVLHSPIGTFRIMKMQGNRVAEVEFSPAIDDATL